MAALAGGFLPRKETIPFDIFLPDFPPPEADIKPGHGRNRLGELPDNQGHFKSCKLAKVLLKEDSDGYTN
jgi:hypothetical protein